LEGIIAINDLSALWSTLLSHLYRQMHVVAHQTKSMDSMPVLLHPLLQEEINLRHTVKTYKNDVSLSK
jgi:hypothetical protein